LNLILSPISNSRIALTWEYPADEVNTGLDLAEASLRKEIKRLSGDSSKWKKPGNLAKSRQDRNPGIPAPLLRFRPEAIPREMLWQHLGNEIRKRYVEGMLDRLWKDALIEHDLKPMSQPQFGQIDINRDKPMTIRAEVDVQPKIALNPDQYRGLYVEIPSRPEVMEVEIDRALEQYRQQQIRFRAGAEGEIAEPGDLLIIRKKERPLGTGEEAWSPEEHLHLQLGEGNFQPLLQQAMLGARAGDCLQFVQDTNGQPVEVRIEVEDLKKRYLPSLEDIARDEGCQDLEQMRANARKRLQENAALLHHANLRRAIMAQIIMALPDFELPLTLVQQRFDLLWREAAVSAMRQGRTLEPNEENRGNLSRLAGQLAAEELVLDEIIRTEGIEADESDVEAEIRRIATRDQEAVENVREWAEKDGKLPLIRRQICWNKAIEMIAESARVQEVMRLDLGQGGNHA
jgi:trigger factor